MALSSAAGLGHLESYSGVAHATLARNVNVVRPQFALFDPDHLARVPHLLRSLDLLHTHSVPLSLHSRTLISPTHVAARLAGCARARTHLAQPRASPTLLAGHAVVEGVPARRRADQSRTSHSTQWQRTSFVWGCFAGRASLRWGSSPRPRPKVFNDVAV